MEAVGRKRRIGVGWRALAALALGLGIWGLAPRLGAPPPPRLGPVVQSVAIEPIVDFGRLYTLDHLVLGGDPRIDLSWAAPVGAGPPGPAVPEPGFAVLWILGLTTLYTLYLPARSW